MSAVDPADVFRQEAAELLDNLEVTLLDLGHDAGNRDLVDAAFRAMHTIKGSGAMFGFDRLAAFTHDFETAFDLVRQGKVAASQSLVQVALAARDHMRALIEDPDGADAVIGRSILDNLQVLVDPAAAVPAGTATRPAAAAPAAAARGWRRAIRFRPDVLRNGTDPLALLDELRDLGPCTVRAVLDDVPALDALDPKDLHVAWTVDIEGECSRQAIDDVFVFALDSMDLGVTPLGVVAAPSPVPPAGVSEPVALQERVGASEPVAASEPAAERRERSRRGEDRPSSSVRVPAERLDELMDRVGELVIAQARLSQLAHGRIDPNVKAVSEEIERLAAGLRDITMGIRMVPIGSLFARFRRLVHDLSRDLGKPVDLNTEGEDTELDKTMIERLADPLVHVIRNAVDHGLESPERRAAAGKPAAGRIALTARHVGTQVLITVEDDGGGLDTKRIRAKAEERGLVSPGAAMSDADIHQILFQPGFSTAQTVSALSGRGVGMDVVKRNIEAMRGTIDLSSEAGRGTNVTLRLPLTLAIIEGLLIRVGEGRYIVPLSAIEECIELPAGQDARSRARDRLDVRGRLVPLLRLREMFDAEGAPDAHQKVIIVSVGDSRVGLVADAIVASHQTVIKSLSKLHADATMFSGATILGDGSAALILDVAQLVALGEPRPETATARTTHAEASTAMRAA